MLKGGFCQDKIRRIANKRGNRGPPGNLPRRGWLLEGVSGESHRRYRFITLTLARAQSIPGFALIQERNMFTRIIALFAFYITLKSLAFPNSQVNLAIQLGPKSAVHSSSIAKKSAVSRASEQAANFASIAEKPVVRQASPIMGWAPYTTIRQGRP